MRVMGLDPGLRRTGWGVIETTNTGVLHIANGFCQTTGDQLGQRLLSLYQQLTIVVDKFQPDEAAVEETFVNTNFGASLRLGHARGVAILAVAQKGIQIGEYAPNTVKKAVTGVGHAEKHQVESMIRLQLPKVEIKGADAADALAVALAHSVTKRFSGKLEDAIANAELNSGAAM